MSDQTPMKRCLRACTWKENELGAHLVSNDADGHHYFYVETDPPGGRSLGFGDCASYAECLSKIDAIVPGLVGKVPAYQEHRWSNGNQYGDGTIQHVIHTGSSQDASFAWTVSAITDPMHCRMTLNGSAPTWEEALKHSMAAVAFVRKYT